MKGASLERHFRRGISDDSDLRKGCSSEGLFVQKAVSKKGSSYKGHFF
jgi:hypothetical protein